MREGEGVRARGRGKENKAKEERKCQKEGRDPQRRKRKKGGRGRGGKGRGIGRRGRGGRRRTWSLGRVALPPVSRSPSHAPVTFSSSPGGSVRDPGSLQSLFPQCNILHIYKKIKHRSVQFLFFSSKI